MTIENVIRESPPNSEINSNVADVVVIGAGPAGLNISCLLGKSGVKVTLLESKRDLLNIQFNTLGSFIDLEKFGLSENVVAARVTEAILHSRDIHVKKKGNAYIINKKQLHKELLDKINSNVEIHPGTHVSKVDTDEKGNVRSVVDEAGNEYKAQIFIDASGIAGVLSKSFGLQDKNLEIARGLEYNVEYFDPQNRVHFFIGKQYKGGYAWIFPVGGKRAIIGFCSMHTDVHESLKEMFDSILELDLIKRLVRKDNDRVSGGTIPLTEVKKNFTYNNVLCLGDSVSQVNPFVGEGYRFILDAGFIAAPYICKALELGDMKVLKNYEKEWNLKYYEKYKKCKNAQKWAGWASKNDLITDAFSLFLSLKRNQTFENIMAGNITSKEIWMP